MKTKTIFKSILQPNRENKHWVEKNWFFAATLFIVLSNIILYTAFGTDWGSTEARGTWNSFFSFDAMFHAFFNGFSHLDLRHVLFNMLCFSIVGTYLERKYGSIKLLLIVLALGFFTSMTVSANYQSLNWRGFSVINYALYFFSIIDFLFSLRDQKRNKSELIVSGVILGLIIILMSFDTTEGLSFMPLYGLFNNMGHYSGVAAGIVFGLTVQLSKLKFIVKV